MSGAVVAVVILVFLAFLWATGSFQVYTSTERFNNMQPVDFHASMLNKYQDYVYDNVGMKNKDYLLESLVHT